MNTNPDELLISAPVELKFVMGDPSEPGMFDAMAATFDGVDSQGDTIRPGAFADSIMKHKAAGTMPALLWSHNPAEPIGSLTSMHETATGLQIKGKLNLKTESGLKAHEHMKAGDVTGMSIGYQVPPGGAEHLKGGLRVLKKAHVHEISVVSMPSDNRARILGVKMLTSMSELERGLRGEIPLALARGAAQKIAQVGWPALVGAVDEPDPAIAAKLIADTRAMNQLAAKIDAARLELKSIRRL